LRAAGSPLVPRAYQRQAVEAQRLKRNAKDHL
jgi:hypothetical protein